MLEGTEAKQGLPLELVMGWEEPGTQGTWRNGLMVIPFPEIPPVEE